MLDAKTLEALRGYAQRIQHPVQIKLYNGAHPKREGLITFLKQVASVSDLISIDHSQTNVSVREGLTFELMSEGVPSGVFFSGIPGGHEFSSFVLALLQVGGNPIRLDAALQRQIQALNEPLSFESIVSLDCHICPDVVQLFNQMAVLNPLIRHEMIDGALHQELVSERNVQGVPSIFLEKKPFASGAVTISEILERLTDIEKKVSDDVGIPQQDPELYDVAVIGGGPAAVASAVYTARKGLKVVMVAEKLGGQLNDTQAIENFISMSHTTGAKLAGDLSKHLEDYTIRVREEVRVKSLVYDAATQRHKLALITGELLESRTIIIATGARWRELNVPGERENIGRGVAYCPHCDGPFFKGKNVTVVGGGNSGVEAALDLAGIAQSVTVVEFADSLKADQVLIDKVEAAANIRCMTGVETHEIIADAKGVTGMRLQRRATEEAFEHSTDGVFVQIGLVPNSHFLGDIVERNHFGEVKVNDRCQTSLAGVFACGDVTNVPYKQIVIAIGEGAKAGLSAFDYLLKAEAPEQS